MTQNYGDIDDDQELFTNVSVEVQSVIEQVVKAESDKLYQDKPNIKSDILRIIKEVVNENNINSIV
jgi:hypothetical protein